MIGIQTHNFSVSKLHSKCICQRQNYTAYVYGKCIWIRYCKYILEKTEGQSRETGNIGNARHKTKTKKTHTQYVLDTTNTQTLVYDKGSDRHSDNRKT